MKATKVTGTLALARLLCAGKLGCSYSVLLPVLLLCVAPAAWSQPPRIFTGPQVPPRVQVGVQQAQPAAAIPVIGKYRFHTIDIPGSSYAQANGINNAGLVTGWYQDASNHIHGFTWQAGALQTVDYPGAVATYLNATNNLGGVIGYYVDTSGNDHAVTYSSVDGTWTTLPDIPDYVENEGYGINDAGVAVGYDIGVFGNIAWIWHPATLSYSFFTAPGAAQASTFPMGINDKRQVAGFFTDVPHPGLERGFLKEGSTYTNIDFPGANVITTPLGINNSGAITGWFCNTNQCGGFVRASSGVFRAVNHPGSKGSTTIGGANDRGDICGNWYNSVASVWQAFVASPQ